MLGRLRIRQKLGVLLAIPLTAVALVMSAFTLERVGEAQAYAATEETALSAREIGGLIQTLQQERLLALGYLVLPTLERSAIVRQGQTAVAETSRLSDDPRTADIIDRSRPQLDALHAVRTRVIDRSINTIATYYSYRIAVLSLMDSLGLARPDVADADGLRELLALDSLMRSNEEASSAGAIVVGAASSPEFTTTLLRTAQEADTTHLIRFKQLVDPDQVSLVDMVESGAAGERLRDHVQSVLNGNRPRSAADVSAALTAALTYTGLRRLAQDRVAREAALSAQRDAAAANRTAVGVAAGAAAVFFLVVVLAVTVSRSIARPLGRLGRAVGAVAELSRAELVRVADSEALDVAPPELASVDVDSDDEIGDLAAAVNRVQSTAAMLLERQASARANVATMFANVSRRTQNLVGRQLQIIEGLSRTERDPATRETLSQLEHLTTRLRRSADSLLVVSGTVDPQLTAMPARLATVIDAALVEIEEFKRVEVVEPIPDVAISAEVAPDLRLLLAELLENATSFTPPGSSVRVGAAYDRDVSFAADCTIAVVDQGLGMSPSRIEEENRRLVERERLDVAPTRVLGLFVVGRVARRHGLAVRLESSTSRGITAFVRIPARLLTPASAPSGPGGLGIVPPMAAAAIESAARSGPFPWLATRDGLAAIAAAPVSAAPVTGAPVSGAPNGVRTRDPEREREALNAYLSGFARAAGNPAAEPDPRSTVEDGELHSQITPVETEIDHRTTLAERHQ